MPIDLDKALGAEIPVTTHAWDEDDVILYHLSVGAGVPATDPGELAYTYEPQLKVLPSYGSIPAFASMMGVAAVDGLDFNLAMLLHGEQETILTTPLPTTGSVTNRARISEIYDKGKGALVIVEVVSEDAAGDELFRNRASVFLRGEGGFGGESGPPAGNLPPERDPDHVVESPTMEQQALLYRLNGDRNPLHADPAFAAMGGFDRPILHGLCSYGIVCKAAIDAAFDGDTAAVASYGARFAGAVLPGDTIVTTVWDEGETVFVDARTKERDTPVITNAALTRRAS